MGAKTAVEATLTIAGVMREEAQASGMVRCQAMSLRDGSNPSLSVVPLKRVRPYYAPLYVHIAHGRTLGSHALLQHLRSTLR